MSGLPPPRPPVTKDQLYQAFDAISEIVKKSIINNDFLALRGFFGDEPFQAIWELTRPDAYCLQTDLTEQFLARHPQFADDITMLEHLSFWDGNGEIIMAMGHGTGKRETTLTNGDLTPDLWYAIDKMMAEHNRSLGVDPEGKGVIRGDKPPSYQRGKKVDQQVEAFRADMDSIFETWKER